MLYRKQKRIVHNETILHLNSEVLEPEVFSSMEEEYIGGLLNQLTDDQKEVFRLYVIEGYSHKEIRNLMSIAEGTSRSHLTRSKTKLRALFNQHKISRYESC